MAKITTRTIFWYIPNQIGYLRVITAIMSFFLMKNHPVYTTLIYGISCLLDALDGTAARAYNQTSCFGAVLDMVTDRSTTSSLICFLCLLYPQWTPIFQLLISLDLSSHYIHMYATLSAGSSKSHKSIEKENWLLHLYYSRRDVLFTICAFNELFYVALYLYAFPIFKISLAGSEYSVAGIIAVLCLPGYIFKQIANVVQLQRASIMLAKKDVADAQKQQ